MTQGQGDGRRLMGQDAGAAEVRVDRRTDRHCSRCLRFLKPEAFGGAGMMRRLAGRFAVSILLMALGGGLGSWLLPGATGAQDEVARVWVEAPADPVEKGNDPVAIRIHADDVRGLGHFQLTLKYDPDVLKYVSGSEGPLLGSTGREVGCFVETPEADAVQFFCPTLGPSPPPGVDGSGVLAVVHFEPKSAGVSSLVLEDVLLVTLVTPTTPEPVPLEITTEDGQITVVGGSEVTWWLWGIVVGVVAVAAVAAGVFLVRRRRGRVPA